MHVDWYKCQGNVWCELNKIDAEHKYIKGLDGIIIIWSGEDKNVLKVAKGNVSSEIKKNKEDIAVQAFSHLGLFVTWTDDVSMFNKSNVYSFLINKLKPKFVEDEPKKSGEEVNLPW